MCTFALNVALVEAKQKTRNISIERRKKICTEVGDGRGARELTKRNKVTIWLREDCISQGV